MLIKILLVVGVLLAAFCILAAFQPKAYSVTRSTEIATQADVPFALVNNLHTWQSQISPYTKKDPTAKYTFAGPPAGPGAAVHWEGNAQVGTGTMTITESRPGEFVRFTIAFEKPFRSICDGEFTFQSRGSKTIASWTMRGEKVFATKAMGLVFNMDKMIGQDFETGLARLKVLSEAGPKL